MKSIHALVALLTAMVLSQSMAAAVPAGGQIILPFGVAYASPGGGSSIHRGADVACASGRGVSSPVSGEVSFAGRVPSAGGGTVLAVSVRCGTEVVTMLPLSASGVQVGDSVEPGDFVGSIADDGDPSSAATHVHVSLRRDGVYLDPSALLLAVSDADSPAPEATVSDHAVSDPVALPSPVTAQAGAAISPGVSVAPRASSAGAPVVCPAPAPNPALTTKPDSSNGESARPLQIADGVTLAQAPGAPAGPGPLALRSIAREFQRSLPQIAASPPSLALVATAVIAVSLLLTRRGVERRIQSNPPVSDRFGSMLQHLRAGDTLCGLTSCPGLLPSQSRGRLAQRR